MWLAFSLGLALGVGSGDASATSGWANFRGELDSRAGLIRIIVTLTARDGYPPRQDETGRDIGDQHERDQHQAGGPGLTMPVVKRGNRVRVDHDGQRGRRLRDASPPELIVKAH